MSRRDGLFSSHTEGSRWSRNFITAIVQLSCGVLPWENKTCPERRNANLDPESAFSTLELYLEEHLKKVKTQIRNGGNSKLPERFPKRFVFHGNAVAAGVFLTKIDQQPANRVSPVQGQSSLPVIGGLSESSVPTSNPEFERFFSYRDATTRAEGIRKGDTAITTVSASLKNLRMVNRPSPDESAEPREVVFRAGALALALRSTHRRGQPKIEFENLPQADDLFLDEIPVQLEFRQAFLKLSRMQDLEEKFRTDKRFYAENRDAFMLVDPKRPPAFGQRIPRMNGGYAVCSIVKSIRWGDQTINGHVLTKTGFGSIYFGEMLVNDNNRRITLVRVKMGSLDEAEGAFIEVDPNGDWVPPQN